VIHVAGTNGKGSTCAFLRAIAEAAGLRVHVYTSPHLVRFRERFRIAGALVEDATLQDTLEQIEAINGGAPITVFEVMTAAAFVLFARTPAELCVLEVGLGGRGDATNVIPAPAACAITSISLDHQEMLGDSLAKIATEKAGIIKPGVPVITGAQPPEALAVIAAHAGAALAARGRDWWIEPRAGGVRYHDSTCHVSLPHPALPGLHQHDNAGIAIAALLRCGLPIPADAFAAGLEQVEWPARLQLLRGRLGDMLPGSWELWLDGGHNPGAGEMLANHIRGWHDRPTHLIVGMKQSKDPGGFLRPLLPLAASVWAVVEPGQHLAMPVEAIIAATGGSARPGPTVRQALLALASPAGPPARVLVCGSLYLAGEVLKQDAAS
jgi:dihydrofolate synthase/folylpolyglutamate synthase